MPTAKSTTYRARTHRLRGGAKTPAAKSAKAKKPATKKSKKPELTPRMKEFVNLAKAHKQREFFEKLTDAELDTFAKALKMKPSDSREKKLAEVIAYSKKKKSALILINSSIIGAEVLIMAAYLYFLAKKRGEAKKITNDEREERKKNSEQQQAYKLISTIFAGGTGVSSLAFSQDLNRFKRFQKALRALK